MGYPFFRRKRKLIKPAYQIKVTLTIVVSLIIYSVILGMLIFYPLWMELQSASSIYEKEKISYAILSLHKVLWPAVIVISLLVGIQVIFASHRVAGPIYRLEKTLEELINGNFSIRMRLRKGDEFKELEGVMNRLAEYLEGVKKRDEALHQELLGELKALKSSLEKEGVAEDTKQRLARLIERLATEDVFSPEEKRG